MLSEARRQAYLSAMGIDVLYPRRPLPGARPSPVYELPEPQSSPDIRQLGSKPLPAGQPAQQDSRRNANLQSMRESLGGIGKATARKSAAEPVGAQADVVTHHAGAEKHAAEQSTTEPAQSDVQLSGMQPSLQFRLRYWPVSEQLALLAEEPVASAGMQQECQALLKAILAALGQAMPGRNEEFVWPFSAAMPASETGADKAAQALQGFIMKRLERDTFTNLLVFSSQLPELLPEAHAHPEQAEYQLATNAFLTRTHSLGALLQVPELKREVWAQLQPLRKRLQSGE